MNGLMLVTDRTLCGQRELADVVAEALDGGVNSVQMREKSLSTRRFIEDARALKNELVLHDIPLIINDRVDVVLAVGADGVHLGQDDMPVCDARKILGPESIIGLSVETWEDVEQAQDLDVDYLGISPVFSTSTKTDTKDAWGLEGVKRIHAYSRHPLVAIGGINAGNASGVIQAGADCLAVVSAICAAPDPRQAASVLSSIIKDAQLNRVLSSRKSGS